MVDGLELKPTVEEVEPLGAVDIQSRAELALGKRLGRTQVGSWHSPMGEGDLDMKQDRDGVGYKNEAHAGRPVGQSAPDQAITKERPVARHEYNLEPSCPPGGAELGGAWGEEMQPGEDVKVEASDGHDWVVGVFLVGHEDICGLVPYESEIVEGAVDRLEVGRRVGEQRDVL